MKRIRPLIFAATVILSAFLAYGLFTLPRPEAVDSEGFSSHRVLNDIEVISRDHHSVAHPQERASVREYLVSRLESLGADTVCLFEYDSLVGPQNKHVVYEFDAVDILAEFAPCAVNEDADEDADEDAAYLMFVAHYDSRYSQPMPKDTVWSYGAADDGYGVGVALETVSQLLKERENWKQGVKVLFTDAEEVGMLGMKSIWEKDRQVFDNVGLVINIEARGPWGPALLFETSPGNEKLMELYARAAEYPYTYSLTTVVYGLMPNFTDFTVVKDEIPGMNFSTVADINHYHTDLDNFSNVSARSVQHYGSQILPVAQEYLTDPAFADRKALVADRDVTSFTIPALGLVKMSGTLYKVVNIIVFVLFLLVFALESFRRRIKPARVFLMSAILLVSALGVLLLFELLSWLCALACGANFKPFGIVAGVRFDNIAMIVMTILLSGGCIAFYSHFRRMSARNACSLRSNAMDHAIEEYSCTVLYGASALLLILSAVLVFTLGENLMFLIPLACATAALILWRVSGWKGWMPMATALILLHSYSFLYALAMSLTIGAYGAVAMIAFLDIMVLIPIADIYCNGKRQSDRKPVYLNR